MPDMSKEGQDFFHFLLGFQAKNFAAERGFLLSEKQSKLAKEKNQQ